MLIALLTGIGISVANTAIGFVVIFYAYNKEWQTFSRWLTISITGRFFALAVAMWYSLTVLQMPSLPLAISFTSSTFLLILLEIIIINSRLKYSRVESIIKNKS